MCARPAFSHTLRPECEKEARTRPRFFSTPFLSLSLPIYLLSDNHSFSLLVHTRLLIFEDTESVSVQTNFPQNKQINARVGQFAHQEKTWHNTQEVEVKHQNCFLLAILFLLRPGDQPVILPSKPSPARSTTSFAIARCCPWYSMALE
jgi:hypothetical protein